MLMHMRVRAYNMNHLFRLWLLGAADVVCTLWDGTHSAKDGGVAADPSRCTLW